MNALIGCKDWATGEYYILFMAIKKTLAATQFQQPLKTTKIREVKTQSIQIHLRGTRQLLRARLGPCLRKEQSE